MLQARKQRGEQPGKTLTARSLQDGAAQQEAISQLTTRHELIKESGLQGRARELLDR